MRPCEEERKIEVSSCGKIIGVVPTEQSTVTLYPTDSPPPTGSPPRTAANEVMRLGKTVV